MRAFGVALSVVLVGLAAACGRGAPPRGADQGAFRAASSGASVDPTVHAARLLPEIVDETQGYGSEPGGGVRAITAGLRVVSSRDGAIVAADDRLPQPPTLTTALPERLGGGFLFVLGSTVWRADHWLDVARPIFVSPQGIQAIVPGLDRVYLRSQNAYLALDGRNGTVLDLGPWPATPFVASYAAADGWRAAAVTDLRGVVATFDAGATWRALDLPIDPRLVLVTGDALAVGGVENGRPDSWFEVRGDGAVARLAGPPREAKGKMIQAETPPRRYLPGGYPVGMPVPPTSAAPARPKDGEGRDETTADSASRIFGKRPLAVAIEDGWPLTDGTAVVARDGALGRVRLSDGVLVDLAPAAFPLKPAQCHPVSLTRASAPGAFGFVCGEPRGTTIIYAYDPLQGRLVELRRFDRPRVVTSSGSGAIAVRGPCAADGDPNGMPREPARIPSRLDAGADADASSGAAARDERELREKEEREQAAKDAAAAKAQVHPYCMLGHDNAWREIHVRGDMGSERVVQLADGKVLVVSPPQGETTPARLTLLENGHATTIPVLFPAVSVDIARVLRLGVWLDGFEERRPGILGGWIEAGGAMLGIQIALDGKATPGQFVRDAGLPFVAGRYGFGWTASRRGFETTDGGMTWTSLELPDALVTTRNVERRACGPIGCLAAGWLRVGWGEARKTAASPPPPPFRAPVTASPAQLALACEPTSPPMPPPPAPPPRATSTPTVRAESPRSFGGPPVLANLGASGVVDMPPFLAQGAPVLHDGERGVPVEVQEHLEHYPRLGALARIYTWGPKSGDWDVQGHWQVKWLSPFAAWPETCASVVTLPPQSVLQLSNTSGAFGSFGSFNASGLFQITSGDDSAHALLLARRPTRTDVTPIELEADHAPIEIRRADGEPFLEIEGATRAAGRWFFATPPPIGASSPTTTVWQADGAVARELVRVARAAPESGRPTGTRLARRSDGRSLGLVVDGAPTAERSTATRWVLPIDLETGQRGEPELLGYADLAGRTLETCTDDLVGWVFDVSLPASSVRLRLPSGSGSLHSVYARVRATSTRACIERLAGTYDGQSPDRLAQITRPFAPRAVAVAKPGELIASALAGPSRVALRCTVAK